MTELAKIIKSAMTTSRGCCHNEALSTCDSCMAQHIADTIVLQAEGKFYGISR